MTFFLIMCVSVKIRTYSECILVDFLVGEWMNANAKAQTVRATALILLLSTWRDSLTLQREKHDGFTVLKITSDTTEQWYISCERHWMNNMSHDNNEVTSMCLSYTLISATLLFVTAGEGLLFRPSVAHLDVSMRSNRGIHTARRIVLYSLRKFWLRSP